MLGTELVVTRVDTWVLPPPANRVLVRVGANGVVGWGEATPAGPAACAAESAAMIATTVERCLAPMLLGRPVWDIDGAALALAGGRAAGALDMALHDLVGRALHVPLGVLWGARRAERIPLGWRVTGGSAAEAADSAKAGLDQGYRAFLMDVQPPADGASIGAVRDAVGDVPLSVDAHGGYTVDGALRMARLLADRDVTAFARPLPVGDIEGLRALRAAASVPIAVRVRRSRDLVNLLGAIDIAVVGTFDGLTGARRLCGLAEDFGVRLMGVGGGGALGIAAALHLFAASAVEAPIDVGRTGLPYADVPTGPGLGVRGSTRKEAR